MQWPPEELTLTIYEVAGDDPANLRLLIHAATQPDNSETFSSLIARNSPAGASAELYKREWLTSLWQTPLGTVYTCSMSGRIYSKAGDSWNESNLGAQVFLNSLWGIREEPIYVCGLDAASFIQEQGRWRTFSQGLTGDLKKVSGLGPDDLYILGSKGEIFHYGRREWARLESPTNQRLISILCVSPDEIYLCGRRGMLFRGSNNRWERLGNVEFTLYALARYQDALWVAGGTEGLFRLENGDLKLIRDVHAYGLHTAGGRLIAYGETSLHEFDGERWSSVTPDFLGLIKPYERLGAPE